MLLLDNMINKTNINHTEFWYPHVTVATVVEKDGKYLLVQELSAGHLVYNQPAGHLEKGETLTEAALRETLEESRWQVKIKGIVGTTLFTSPVNGITYHRTTFYAEAVEERLDLSLDTGIARAVWMSYQEILSLSDKMRSERVIQTINQYRAGHRYPLEFIYGD